MGRQQAAQQEPARPTACAAGGLPVALAKCAFLCTDPRVGVPVTTEIPSRLEGGALRADLS